MKVVAAVVVELMGAAVGLGMMHGRMGLLQEQPAGWAREQDLVDGRADG